MIRPVLFLISEACPTLRPVNLEFSCHRGNMLVDCNNQIMNGTEIRFRCQPLHREERKVNYREIMCRENGEWNRELPKCMIGNEIVDDRHPSSFLFTSFEEIHTTNLTLQTITYVHTFFEAT
jgi:hypothetical protein